MKKNLKKLTLLLATLSLMSIVCSTQAEAAYSVSIDANADGFTMLYRLPLVATGMINLKEGGPAKNINLTIVGFRLAQISLSFVSTATTETGKTLKLHYVVSGRAVSAPIEGDLDVRLCKAVLTIDLFKKLAMPVLADHDVKVFLLLKKNKTTYDVNINTGAIVADSWSGTATADDNVVVQPITMGGIPLEAKFVFDYSTPMVTKCDYSFSALGSTSQPSNITLPNGMYSLWIDFYK